MATNSISLVLHILVSSPVAEEINHELSSYLGLIKFYFMFQKSKH